MNCGTTTIAAVIPSYNNAAFLPDTVRSIRTQTTPVNEIIIVDDGSTDKTAEVVQTLGSDIRYIHQDNAGPSAARNRGAGAAETDFIAFLDADDRWTNGRIERQLGVMERYSQVALVAGDMQEIDNDNAVLAPSVLARHNMLQFFEDLAGAPVPDAFALLMRINFIPTGTVLIRKAAFDDTGGFSKDIRYGEDLEVWAKIASKHPIVCLPEVLMLRRQHGKNATRNTGPLLEDLVKVTKSARSWGGPKLREQGLDPDRLVADALWQLGYWYFTQEQLAEARRIFSESLREKFTRRSLLFASASMMPNFLVYKLRNFKQKLAGSD
ncbi:glycosyltransferase [Gammaproteobacteria bacterium]|nr:glycosyltransferase [Gammaproteobacteria bacterium]